jgi:DNA replication and repair protein RecF
MRLSRITLEHFRNIPLAELTLVGRQQFFVGQNGQGKTNLLEAVSYLTALRSFRTSDQSLLIGHGQPGAGLAYELEHELLDDTGVTIKLRTEGKEVTCDGEWVTKFSEYLGRFPTVVFSAQDQQLVRGAPAFRRRWLDLTIAAMDTGYLQLLQQYHRAVLDRNRLLKSGATPLEFAAFELPLATAAAQIVQKRTSNVKVLSGYVAAAYAAIARIRQYGRRRLPKIGRAIFSSKQPAQGRTAMILICGLANTRCATTVPKGSSAAWRWPCGWRR